MGPLGTRGGPSRSRVLSSILIGSRTMALRHDLDRINDGGDVSGTAAPGPSPARTPSCPSEREERSEDAHENCRRASHPADGCRDRGAPRATSWRRTASSRSRPPPSTGTLPVSCPCGCDASGELLWLSSLESLLSGQTRPRRSVAPVRAHRESGGRGLAPLVLAVQLGSRRLG